MRQIKPASPEFRALADRQHVESWEKFGPMLDAMLLEAQTLRLRVGHKARERTLSSLGMDQASHRPSQAAE